MQDLYPVTVDPGCLLNSKCTFFSIEALASVKLESESEFESESKSVSESESELFDTIDPAIIIQF